MGIGHIYCNMQKECVEIESIKLQDNGCSLWCGLFYCVPAHLLSQTSRSLLGTLTQHLLNRVCDSTELAVVVFIVRIMLEAVFAALKVLQMVFFTLFHCVSVFVVV